MQLSAAPRQGGHAPQRWHPRAQRSSRRPRYEQQDRRKPLRPDYPAAWNPPPPSHPRPGQGTRGQGFYYEPRETPIARRKQIPGLAPYDGQRSASVQLV